MWHCDYTIWSLRLFGLKPGDVPGPAVTLVACWAARPRLIHKSDPIGCPPKHPPVPLACFWLALNISHAPALHLVPAAWRSVKFLLNPHISICCGWIRLSTPCSPFENLTAVLSGKRLKAFRYLRNVTEKMRTFAPFVLLPTHFNVRGTLSSFLTVRWLHRETTSITQNSALCCTSGDNLTSIYSTRSPIQHEGFARHVS